MLMRLMRSNVKAKYTTGKEMLLAKALSRNVVSAGADSSHNEIQAHVNEVVSSWPVSDGKIIKIREETQREMSI